MQLADGRVNKSNIKFESPPRNILLRLYLCIVPITILLYLTLYSRCHNVMLYFVSKKNEENEVCKCSFKIY